MKKSIVVLFVLIPVFSFAQFFQLFDVDESNYPEMTAKFIAMDSVGNQITNIKKENVVVQQNNLTAKVIGVKNPIIKKIQPVSVVLTIDVSGSMIGTNVELAKEAAKTFVELTPLEISEIAITSFDNYNYLNQDFTKDADKLYEAIDAITAQGGTSYDQGFTETSSGGMFLARKGLYKKVVIFLTDGLGSGETSEIIKMANENDITAYCITVNMPMPDILRDVAEQTGGGHYEYVNSIETAKEVYIEILQTIQNSTFGEITWIANPTCNTANTVTIDFMNIHTEFTYHVPLENTIILKPNVEYINFGIVPVGDSIHNTIKTKALNSDIEIISIKNTYADIFKLKYNKKTPFLLKDGQTLSLNVNFVPQEEDLLFSRIDIETDKCENLSIFVNGGNPGVFSSNYKANIKVVSPNGGESFLAGTESKIFWEGVNRNDTVSIEYSIDNGKNYTKIKEAVGLKTSFNVPLVKSSNCIVRIQQKNIPIKLNKFSRTNNPVSGYFSNDGNQVVVAAKQTYIHIYNVLHNKLTHTFRAHDGHIQTAKFNSDASKIISTSLDETAIIWDVESGEELLTLKSRRFCWIYFKKAHTAPVLDATFSPDGRQVVTAGADNLMIIWETEKGKILHRIEAHRDIITSVEYSPDSTKILTSSFDNTAKIWDSNTGDLLSNFPHSSKIYYATFSPTGNMLATGDADGIITIWDTKTETEIKQIEAHKSAVRHLDFSPEGSRLVSAGADQTVKIWDVSSGKVMQTIYGKRRNDFASAEFSPEGSRVLTVTMSGHATIWTSYLAPLQQDLSDTVFSIISPIPQVSEVKMKSGFVDEVNTEIAKGFIQNTNSDDIFIKSIQIHGKDASCFYIVSGLPPYKISANSNKNVEFGFKSAVEGNKEAEIFVITAMDTVKTKISCRALELPFEINDRYVDFGKVKPEEFKNLNVPILRNISDQPLKIVKFRNTGPDLKQFKINSRFVGKKIQPGNELKLNATYSPKKRGQTSTSIRIYLEGYNTPVTINLLGECDAPRFVKVQGIITDEISGEPLSALVYCYDKISGRVIVKASSNKKGEYSCLLPVERIYKIEANKKGYLPSKKQVNLRGLFTEEIIKQDFQILQLYSGSKVVLHINFDTGKSLLKTEEKTKLQGIINYLKDHPEQNVEISGHTDDVGTIEHNLELSDSRAKSVKNYFVSQGIVGSRMTTMGFGKSQPMATNESEAGKQENRRVEIKFIN